METDINARLATKEPARPSYKSSFDAPPQSSSPKYGLGASPLSPVSSSVPKTGKSFLDEWLAKKKQASQSSANKPGYPPSNIMAANPTPPVGITSNPTEEPATVLTKPQVTPLMGKDSGTKPPVDGNLKQQDAPEHVSDDKPATDKEIKILRNPEPGLHTEDTIYIDKDGGLHNRDDS